jgi:methyl-accepting chemotaxis protein
MNFQQAIQAHVNWKMKLASYIANPDKSLNPVDVSASDGCELGKWLSGEGRKYATAPEFAPLAANHARFHAAAGEIIRKADAGQCVEEEVALGGKSAFSQASAAVVSALMKLKSKIAA